MTDSLGDRMKAYEAAETERRFLPLLPIYARIDGRCFSSFTRGMSRPFDAVLSACMVDVTQRLVSKTGARAGYTQSDEISLVWYRDTPQSKDIFDGKVFKLTSVIASMTTAFFINIAREHWPELVANQPPMFDARIFVLPNTTEAANAFLWRELDATKNAVSMAARAHLSHNALQGKSGSQMQEMLFQQKDINFNDYPARFKRGTFVLRHRLLKELDPDVLARIPEKHRPTGPILRDVVAAVEMPRFSKVTNRVAVLFDGAVPEIEP